MKDFYAQNFDLSCSELYVNSVKNFSSYFLSFENGARLELMHQPGIGRRSDNGMLLGITHFAVSVGSSEKVDSLTETFRKNGHQVVGEPRTTGDGYYESVIMDPEGNRVELTI